MINMCKTENYKIESHRIFVEHTTDHLNKVTIYEGGVSGNSFRFEVSKLDDVISVLSVLRDELNVGMGRKAADR